MNLNFRKGLSLILILLFCTAINGSAQVLGDSVRVSNSSDKLESGLGLNKLSYPTEEKPVTLSKEDLRQMEELINQPLSYEERLELLVSVAIAFDHRTAFNPYSFINWNVRSMKNNYVFEYVTFRKPKQIKFLPDKHEISLADPYLIKQGDNKFLNHHLEENWQTFSHARNSILINRPNLVVCHWDVLPDPPAMVDTVFLPLINIVDLGYELSNSYENKDYKIESLKRVVSPWTFKGMSSLHSSETFVSNWASGGQKSISILGVVDFDADYEVKDLKWENFFQVKLGALYYQEEKDDEKNNEIRKNADEFKINSKVGYKAIKNWYYTFSMDINSQFFEGKDSKNENIISGFLSPANIFLSAGMDYKYKKKFSVFISPLTFKNTLVLDTAVVPAKKYGIPAGERSKKEIGGYVRGNLKWPINDDITWTSKVYLFSNYREKPENVDVDFENVLDYNFSHVFSLRFSIHMKYDDDTKLHVGMDEAGNKIYGARLQFKQQMSIGLFYRF